MPMIEIVIVLNEKDMLKEQRKGETLIVQKQKVGGGKRHFFSKAVKYLAYLLRNACFGSLA